LNQHIIDMIDSPVRTVPEFFLHHGPAYPDYLKKYIEEES